jgi:hypothetical protein
VDLARRGVVPGNDGMPAAIRFASLIVVQFRRREFGLEGIVSKKLDEPYRSGRTKSWIKVKNPKAPAATRVVDGTF